VLDQADPFLRHKTTRRDPHERAFAEAAALGKDEAILLNRRRLVADGSRSSIFVDSGGLLVTPPVESGALPGILRAHMIASGRAVEGELTLDELSSHPVWVGNSLRGVRPATLRASVSRTASKAASRASE
jgi:para-aminobenzoate synthetase/4-amino-4-deoxychorismate lyase